MAQWKMSAHGRLRSGLFLLLCGGCVPLWRTTPPPPNMGPVGPPGTAAVAAYYSRFNDQQASELAPKLAAALDENKVLMGRLQELQLLLGEKEQVLLLARGEVQMATEEAGRTRQEIERCRQEMARLGEQVRKGEKESQAAMHEMVNLLDVLLQQRERTSRAPLPKTKEPDAPPVPGPSLESSRKSD